MTSKKTNALAASLGTALVATGALQGVALASDAQTPVVPASNVVAEASAQAASPVVQADVVRGTFAFTQTEASSNAWLAKHIGEGAKYLCGSQAVLADSAPAAADWVLTVEGAVANPVQATIGELCETAEVQSVFMGCACAGNQVDGLAVANALVQGVSVMSLLQIAQPDATANTIVFVSADGYEMALPLSYVQSHYCPLVFNVNGSALVESVGGTNQLWLGSTPASYFVRDVASIRLEARDEVPASPTSDEARESFANLPNVGVMFGGDVA